MKALNVLIVDDADFIRDLIKKGIRYSYPEFKVYEAVDGRKAQALLSVNKIDLILCDWEMPELTGLELLEWVRQDSRYQATPFMMITSRGERDHILSAAQAGVSDYISKPFTQENFLNKIDRLLTKHFAPKGKKAPQPLDALTDNSASVLVAASPKPVQPAVVKLSKESRPPPANGGSVKGVAELRFGDGKRSRCVIKEINLQEMSGIIKRDDGIPQLMDQIVLGIDAGKVARINCYVHALQALEQQSDAQTIEIRLRYVDDDADKLEVLSRFINKAG